MRRYLLETGPLAAYLQGRPRALSLISPWIRQQEVATSPLCYAEINEYIASFPDYLRRHHNLRRLLREVVPYSLTYPVLARYGELRRQMRPPHGPGLIGDIDTLIAATALMRDLTLVTNDTDFQRVPGLKLMLLPSLR
jgi:predicted nucleic acid-binding protein